MRIIALILYATLVFGQNPLEMQELGQFSKHERMCIEELNSDENMLNNALKQPYMPSDNPEFNKFMECTWKKDGFINEKGDIIFKSFRLYVKDIYNDAVGIPDLAEMFSKDTINHCRNVQGDTPGQTGVLLMNCIIARLYL